MTGIYFKLKGDNRKQINFYDIVMVINKTNFNITIKNTAIITKM